MIEPDFVVTLPSNSNMSTNPSNEPGNYTVKLAEPLNLEGDWESALVSVQYTPSWLAFNQPIRFHLFYVKCKTYSEVEAEQQLIDLSRRDTAYSSWVSAGRTLHEEVGKHGASLYTVYKKMSEEMNYGIGTMYPRYYDSAVSLGDAFCKMINDFTERLGITALYEYDHSTKSGRLRIRGGYMHILQENYVRICELLGLTYTWYFCDKCTGYTADLRRDRTAHYFAVNTNVSSLGKPAAKLQRVNALWVYSNITQYQLVGDTKAPLLGIIPTTSNTENRVHYTVNPIHFLAVNRNHIPEISIKIVDDKGEPIPFAKNSDDNLVCCLRFRRRKNTAVYIK